MPLLIGAIGAFLSRYLGSIIGSILAKIGISIVSYVGIGYLITNILDTAIMRLNGLSGDIAAIAGMMQLDTGCNFILSAYTARVSVMAAHNVLNKINWSNGNVTA